MAITAAPVWRCSTHWRPRGRPSRACAREPRPRRPAGRAGGLDGSTRRTSTFQLGTLVSPATLRHPSLLAKLAATADHVSGGRIDLGLGSGWHEREHEAYGFPFPETRVRMDVLEEQLQVILGSWANGPFSSKGSTTHSTTSELSPSRVMCQQLLHDDLEAAAMLGALAGTLRRQCMSPQDAES
ncbi:MAG: LLM class flavin-dependent oxidoreductase [Actinomycetota bacterium]|nr:LLM class flavin-dependent oxidoreductase [Actinomycetota bacterium]